MKVQFIIEIPLFYVYMHNAAMQSLSGYDLREQHFDLFSHVRVFPSGKCSPNVLQCCRKFTVIVNGCVYSRLYRWC